ncbi:MAG: LysR family transcriptional regulator [Anaerolineae bacterium]|nr:LysR family transcriptional regulator [Anaerolineae bacterium]
MELGHLEAFERAAREGSFTRAANALGLTQPSISARIAALEAELGGAVFERGGRRLHLTPLGRAFLPYAERSLAVLADGRDAVRRYAEGKQGYVSVGVLQPLAMYMLARPLERFRMEYPAVDVAIRERHPRIVIDMLYGGTATLGLLGAPVWDKGLAVLARFQEPVHLVAAVDHPLAVRARERESVALADLFAHTIYRVTLNPRVTALVQNLVEQGRRGSGGAVIQVPAVMALQPLILGQGVAFLPESYVQRHITAGTLAFLPVDDLPLLYNETTLVTLGGRDLDQPNAAFARIVRAECRSMLVD